MEEELSKRILDILDHVSHKCFGRKRGAGPAYQAIPEIIGFTKGRNCEHRAKLCGLDRAVAGKVVLDIGSNMGMLSMYLSQFAERVDGVEPFDGYFEVSELLKEHYKNNATFHHSSFKQFSEKSSQKYDVIISFAVSNWVEMSLEQFIVTMKSMLNPGGSIFYESHRGKPSKSRTKSIMSENGFVVAERQSPDEKRYILECTLQSTQKIWPYELCYDYREDIFFRAYILVNDKKTLWSKYRFQRKRRKPNRKMLLWTLRKNLVDNGQLTPVPVVEHDGKLYPADGAKRLSSLISMQKQVVVRVVDKSNCPNWNDHKGLDTKRFDFLSEEEKIAIKQFKDHYLKGVK